MSHQPSPLARLAPQWDRSRGGQRRALIPRLSPLDPEHEEVPFGREPVIAHSACVLLHQCATVRRRYRMLLVPAGRSRRARRSARVITPQEPVTLRREHVLQTVGEAAANALHIERAIDVARDITHALCESRPRFQPR